MGIGGRMYNWIMDFSFGRTVQVRVGTTYSKTYSSHNGTPQGSVYSPVLFNLMLNNVFNRIKIDCGRSLYADDGAIWKSGHNIPDVTRSMQTATDEVEKWANKWNFPVICGQNSGNVLHKKKN